MARSVEKKSIGVGSLVVVEAVAIAVAATVAAGAMVRLGVEQEQE